MTTNLQTRIAAIKAECEEIIELSEKATAGKWQEDTAGVFTGGRDNPIVTTPRYYDRAFIAHSRNVSPAMARVVLECIKWCESSNTFAMERIANQWEGK